VSYVCNGAPGINGTNGTNGVNGTNGTNGANGANGSNGTNGVSALIVSISVPSGNANCPYGGTEVVTGLNNDGSGLLVSPAGGFDAANELNASFVCNGGPGAGAGISWVNVTTDTAVQTVPNVGYIANNDSAPVVFALPDAPAIGDQFQFSAGPASAGWRVAQNPGQAIFDVGSDFVVSAAPVKPPFGWSSMAVSDDGNIIALLSGGIGIFVSSNAGVDWSQVPTAGYYYLSSILITSSLSGPMILVTDDSATQPVSYSIRTGNAWSPLTPIGGETAPPLAAATIAATTFGGSTMVVSRYQTGALNSCVFTGTWCTKWQVAEGSGAQAFALASAPSGPLLVVSNYGQGILSSSYLGGAWSAWMPAATGALGNYQFLAASGDGTMLIGVGGAGGIYISSDSGKTWNQTSLSTPGSWYGVAISRDGAVLGARSSTSQIFMSSDSGGSWSLLPVPNFRPGTTLSRFALSSDGSTLIAGDQYGALYIGKRYGGPWSWQTGAASTQYTSRGVTGSIAGSAMEAVDLQYVGDGIFIVRNHEGTLLAR